MQHEWLGTDRAAAYSPAPPAPLASLFRPLASFQPLAFGVNRLASSRQRARVPHAAKTSTPSSCRRRSWRTRRRSSRRHCWRWLLPCRPRVRRPSLPACGRRRLVAAAAPLFLGCLHQPTLLAPPASSNETPNSLSWASGSCASARLGLPLSFGYHAGRTMLAEAPTPAPAPAPAGGGGVSGAMKRLG